MTTIAKTEESGDVNQQTPSKKTSHKRCSSLVAVLLHIKDHTIERIADFFAWWASIVYDYPYRFILGTLFFVLLMCIGFIPGIPVWIDGAEALYSLPFSTARSQGAVHGVLFNETSTRPSFVLLTGQNPGENVFTWEHLDAVRQIDRLIRGKIVDPKYGRRIGIARKEEYGMTADEGKLKFRPDVPTLWPNATLGSNLTNEAGSPEEANELINLLNNAAFMNRHPEEDRGDAGLDILTFQDICAKNPFGECQVNGVLDMGVFDVKDNLLEPGDPPMLFLFNGLAFNAKKKAFPPHYFLGNAEEVPCSPTLPKPLLTLFYSADQLIPTDQPGMARANMSCITKAEAFQLVYEVSNRDIWTRRNEDWEKVFLDVFVDNSDFGPLKVVVNAFRSRDDALRASTSESSDVLFVALTFAFLVAYSSSLNFSCDLYRSKSYPALSGVIAAILGMIAGMGLMSLCGIAFVPTALVCPFLVVGVGVDDMFVIINGYSLAYMVDSARDRCILSLKDTGLAITVTTTTSLISFIIGLNTGYLSIKNFCWFCGSGMFFGYIFVLTFFFAIHCLDAKREEENLACLFCVPKNKRREARRAELRAEGIKFSSEADITTFTLGALMVRKNEQAALRRHALRLQKKQLAAAAQEACGDAESRVKKMSYNESQETRGSTTPEIDENIPGIEISHQSKKKGGWLRNNFVFKGLIWIDEMLKEGSDILLTRVALEAHYIGKERGLEPDPSNGVLEFPIDENYPTTGDPLIDIVNHPDIQLFYRSTITGERKLFIMEPKGSVGRKWRKFFIRYYGPLLVHPISKSIVFLLFGIFLGIGVYGCTQLESGLDLKDLAPDGSHLKAFDQTQEKFFNKYDYPVDVFFPEFQHWWNDDVQQSMRNLEAIMKQSGSGKLVTNPLIRMLDDDELKPGLQSGDRELFEKTLYNALALENGKYKQFEQNFVWEGTQLRAWKMQILPGAMKSSAERASWMSQIRKDCNEQLKYSEPLYVMSYNYMMTFYESDLQINSSVTSNMIVAAITMLIIALIGIPQLLAGFLVILIMGMIDVDIIGFMYFWGVKLNMVSMICLLLAVGFSVDFTAHVCHTFMDAEGETRNQRAIEALVLMGNPVFHGAASSIIGVLMLGFSTSYVFRVFFKMMTMVTVFALVHAIILLPVILSIVGDSRPHHQHKAERQQLTQPKSQATVNRTEHSGDSSRIQIEDGSKLSLPSLKNYGGNNQRPIRSFASPSGCDRSQSHKRYHGPRLLSSVNSPTCNGRRIRGFPNSPSPRDCGRYNKKSNHASRDLSSGYEGDASFYRQRSKDRESKRRLSHDGRNNHHRILIIEENKTAAAYPEDSFRRPSTESTSNLYSDSNDEYHHMRLGRIAYSNQRPIASICDWKSPHKKNRKSNNCSNSSSNGDWFDEDYRIELANVTPVDERANAANMEKSAYENQSELVSPERRWKSPVERRKHRRDGPSGNNHKIIAVSGINELL